MTPKEKAIELLDAFNEHIEWNLLKKCALICVDEILKNITEEVISYKPFMMNTDYWQEVREEINKL